MAPCLGNKIPDKAQRPESEAKQKQCAKCSGSGKISKADGTKQLCYFCRGTGVSGGNYMTK